MIRKPDQSDFRESGTVSALRDAGTLAVEGARGVRDGGANLVKWWLTGMFGFGFVMSMVTHVNAVGMLMIFGGAVAWFLHASNKRKKREAAGCYAGPREPRVLHGDLTTATGHFDVSVGACGRAAAKLAVPSVLFFPTSGMFSFMLPFTLCAVVALALAFLILARLAGDRAIVRFDALTLTVRGLLGEASILWDDVDTVLIRKTSLLNLRTLFTSGSRHNLVVLGRCNRLGGPERLLIPVDLLGLDNEGRAALITRFLMLQNGVIAEASVSRSAPAVPSAASNAVPAPPRIPDVATHFDPDAIMARYMAEREQVIAEVRPDLVTPRGRPTFGRKLA